MKIYDYHPETGEVLNPAGREARLSPKDAAEGREVYLIPAQATTEAPPETGPNEAAVFDPATGQWSITPDWRGTVHYDPDGGAARLVTKLGVVPEITTPPPAGLYRPQWNGETWTEGEDPAIIQDHLEAQIVDLQMRADAAAKVGLTDRAADYQAQVTARLAELGAIQGKTS